MNDFLQDMLGMTQVPEKHVNLDLVIVLDATDSMEPIMQDLKQKIQEFPYKLSRALEESHRRMDQIRVKILAFRDYYVDGDYAMEESAFFTLPDEKKKLESFVENLGVGGGGDEPENGLEALALAMNSDFVKDGDDNRHIIVLITDSSAHPLELQKEGIPPNYPTWMYQNLDEMREKWGSGQSRLGAQKRIDPMDQKAKRLILFAPDVYPWIDLSREFSQTIRSHLDKGKGAAELDTEEIINMIVKSVRN